MLPQPVHSLHRVRVHSNHMAVEGTLHPGQRRSGTLMPPHLFRCPPHALVEGALEGLCLGSDP